MLTDKCWFYDIEIDDVLRYRVTEFMLGEERSLMVESPDGKVRKLFRQNVDGLGGVNKITREWHEWFEATTGFGWTDDEVNYVTFFDHAWPR